MYNVMKGAQFVGSYPNKDRAEVMIESCENYDRVIGVFVPGAYEITGSITNYIKPQTYDEYTDQELANREVI